MKEGPSNAIDHIKNFLSEKKIDVKFDFESSNPLGFRKKVKLAIRGRIEKPLIGIFKPQTHDVIDLENCQVHDPLINRLIKLIKELIKTQKIEPYCEKTKKGSLRYLQLLINQDGQMQLVLVFCKKPGNTQAIVSFLQKESLLKSVYFNYQPKDTNTIFGDEFELVDKDPFLKINVLGKEFCFHPGSFCQSNLTFFSKILKEIQKELKTYKKGLDLYSGLGLFGLTFIDHFSFMGFCETNPFSKISFEETLKNFPSFEYEYQQEDALTFIQRNLDADCVFVDPPRKGLAKEIKPHLAQLKDGATLVYVSCGYESLTRDLSELLDLGFRIEKIKGFDCFVGSKEIETLVILKKLPIE